MLLGFSADTPTVRRPVNHPEQQQPAHGSGRRAARPASERLETGKLMCFYLQPSGAGSSADDREVRRTGSDRWPRRLTCQDRGARDAAPHLRRVRIGTVPGPARAGRRPASSPKRAPQPRSLHRPSKRAGKKAHPHPQPRGAAASASRACAPGPHRRRRFETRPGPRRLESPGRGACPSTAARRASSDRHREALRSARGAHRPRRRSPAARGCGASQGDCAPVLGRAGEEPRGGCS